MREVDSMKIKLRKYGEVVEGKSRKSLHIKWFLLRWTLKKTYFLALNFVFRAHDEVNGAEIEHGLRFIVYSGLVWCTFFRGLFDSISHLLR